MQSRSATSSQNRLAENRSAKRQVVVVMRERAGRTLIQVASTEAAAVPSIRQRVAKDTVLHADESIAWNPLHASFSMQRINHADVIYLTEKDKFNQVANEIERIHKWDTVELTDGTWLVGLDANGPTANEAIVESYQINASTGGLTQGVTGIYTYTGTQIPAIVPLSVKFAPNQNYLFAAVGTAGDLVFQFNSSSGVYSTGVLQLLQSTSTLSDNALAVSSSGSYLYIARSGTGGGVGVYTIGTGGVLNPVTGSPFAAGSQPFSVVVNSTGTDVYVANQIDSTISGYSVGSTGALTLGRPAPRLLGRHRVSTAWEWPTTSTSRMWGAISSATRGQ